MVNGLPEGLDKYTSSDCDRLSFLQSYLAVNGVQTSVIPVNGKRHLYVKFPLSHYNPLFKIKTIITHYDRVEGSPGANDNSAANIAVADFAQRLMVSGQKGHTHNIRIFFTDGEELGENGVRDQGSFGLAELFHKCGITKDDVYVFDACGRGCVPILARAGLDVKSAPVSFKKQFLSLFTRTQNLLRETCPEHWMSLPVPYSDNAGFLALGIPAVAITLLPEEEASFYFKNLNKNKKLEKAVMNCQAVSDEYKNMLPLTWKLFHTEHDNIYNLTPESFVVMEKLLNSLADKKDLS